jgi:hypothetical protein
MDQQEPARAAAVPNNANLLPQYTLDSIRDIQRLILGLSA